MKNRVVEIVDIVFLNSLAMKSLGEKLTSWNSYFIVNNFATLPDLFVELACPIKDKVN